MKEIVIQQQQHKLRAALLENDTLIEVFEEEEDNPGRLVGNIYRGRVENVLPGMQAAFVDIGLEKNAFLYVMDALPAKFSEDENKAETPEKVRVEQVLKPRQELLVQIIKEPVGTKGARVTTNITLPGRYCVLMPQVDYVGISRKISDLEERERLRDLALKVRKEPMGVIVRTLAKGLEEEELAEDLKNLYSVWSEIQKKVSKTAVPGLVYQDVDLITRLVRDFIDQDIEKITVDQEEIAQVLRSSLQALGHKAARHISVRSRDLFVEKGIDDEIRKALRPKVWLKSGGYLVINQTEALVVIDVNTGKYVGENSLEETVVYTNLEAAREIARQLRLRNLGGIIIIDFIDMVSDEARQTVIEELTRVCAQDKTVSHVLGLTKLGLVEMTRKKNGQMLMARYTKPCDHCEGAGRIY